MPSENKLRCYKWRIPVANLLFGQFFTEKYKNEEHLAGGPQLTNHLQSFHEDEWDGVRVAYFLCDKLPDCAFNYGIPIYISFELPTGGGSGGGRGPGSGGRGGLGVVEW